MISENLSTIRKLHDLTMKEVAEAIGMKPDTYRNYESGRLEPNLATLSKLADFYGVTTDGLLGREPLPNPFADLGLDEETEKEVIEKYKSLSPEIRACTLDVLRKLGGILSGKEREEKTAEQPAPKPNDIAETTAKRDDRTESEAVKRQNELLQEQNQGLRTQIKELQAEKREQQTQIKELQEQYREVISRLEAVEQEEEIAEQTPPVKASGKDGF